MAVRRYSREQLLTLRASPLVQKPDHLPAIEQWIEYVYLDNDGIREKLRIPHSEAHQAQTQSQTPAPKENGGHASSRQRQQQPQQRPGLTDAASPMGSFGAGQRPSLLQMRSGTSKGHGDDVALGPPRTTFPSSSRVSKLSDFHERSTSDVATSDDPDAVRSRFFSDRQLTRKGTAHNSEKEGRDTRESWTSARERRALGESDEPHHARERNDRFSRHDKDQDGERRNGFGDRHESRWGTRDDRRQNGERVGGWREREHQRRERENDRGHAEKEPEWMDDPVLKKDQELNFGMAKTQEEFQKWKEGMSKKVKGPSEKEDVVETAVEAPVPESKPVAVVPLKLDGLDSDMFGGWGSSSSTKAAATPQSETAPPKVAAGKQKTSRFASMFKPVGGDLAAPTENAAIAPTPDLAATSAEDQEGFNRVLQMLGSTKVSKAPVNNENIPTSPPPGKAMGTNGTAGARSKSRFANMFEQKSPENMPSPPQKAHSTAGEKILDGHVRHMTSESLHQFGGRLPDKHMNDQPTTRGPVPDGSMSPEPMVPFNALREQQPRPSSGRATDPHLFSPPSRGAATPDINIQNLLAQQRQRPQATSNESQHLLNLLKKDTSGTSRPPSQQALPANGGIDSAQFQRWLETQHSGGPTETHAPKPRLPQPPGLFEEQLMRNFSSEQNRHEHSSSMGGGPDMPQRRPSQRAPPGFFDEQSLFLQQQQQQQQQQLRRNYGEGPPQPPPMQPHNPRLVGHPNLPPMQIPPQQAGGPPFLPDFHQLTSPNGPPPGFNHMMPRHPPGFHNMPNVYPNPTQHRDGPPPGFIMGAGGNGHTAAGAGGGNVQSPHPSSGPPPPGFFAMPPPGFLPQMRASADGLPPGLRGSAGGGGVPGRGGFDGYDPASVGLGPNSRR